MKINKIVRILGWVGVLKLKNIVTIYRIIIF